MNGIGYTISSDGSPFNLTFPIWRLPECMNAFPTNKLRVRWERIYPFRNVGVSFAVGWMVLVAQLHSTVPHSTQHSWHESCRNAWMHSLRNIRGVRGRIYPFQKAGFHSICRFWFWWVSECINAFPTRRIVILHPFRRVRELVKVLRCWLVSRGEIRETTKLPAEEDGWHKTVPPAGCYMHFLSSKAYPRVQQFLYPGVCPPCHNHGASIFNNAFAIPRRFSRRGSL